MLKFLCFFNFTRQCTCFVNRPMQKMTMTRHLQTMSESTHDSLLSRSDVDGRLEIINVNSKVKEKPFRIDLALSTERKRSCRSDLITRAVGKDASLVIDFTAGVGRDAAVLAHAGKSVIMLERNPILFQLLDDALLHLALSDPDVAGRIQIYHLDSSSDGQAASVIADQNNSDLTGRAIAAYLDPMYEPNDVGRRSSVKKETQMLHRVVGKSEGSNETNNRALFLSALSVTTSRVIVKRALKAKPILGIEPHETIYGTTQRFDLYFKNRRIDIQ